MSTIKTGAIGIIVALALAAGAVLLLGSPKQENRAYLALDIGRLTPALLVDATPRLLPEMLGRVYAAFEETNETQIYDALAEVAAGDALETLYLERVGAMAGGGLDEVDQKIHELELVDISAVAAASNVAVDAVWRVLGTVGHSEHMHMRGNAYSATMTLSPVDDAWKITEFTLSDVDRTEAGELIPKHE